MRLGLCVPRELTAGAVVPALIRVDACRMQQIPVLAQVETRLGEEACAASQPLLRAVVVVRPVDPERPSRPGICAPVDQVVGEDVDTGGQRKMVLRSLNAPTQNLLSLGGNAPVTGGTYAGKDFHRIFITLLCIL